MSVIFPGTGVRGKMTSPDRAVVRPGGVEALEMIDSDRILPAGSSTEMFADVKSEPATTSAEGQCPPDPSPSPPSSWGTPPVLAGAFDTLHAASAAQAMSPNECCFTIAPPV